MTSKKSMLQIAIQTPLRRLFTYLSDRDTQLLQTGSRVAVPFGRRNMIGVIAGFSDQADIPIEKLKTVTDIIDTTPLLDEKLLLLYQWASDYYHHPVGDVILGTLPKKIRDGVPLKTSSEKNISTENKIHDIVLNDEQKIAYNTIRTHNQFHVFLLAGVTGSGKTEVYFRVIADVLAKQQQALVLVPEIALTPQTVSRLQARFCVPVLLLHSGLSDKKRVEAWMRSTENKPCIVIGTRSAVFAPLKNCGVIVVDEEHDMSFKQQAGFRYHARDVAVMRAKLLNIPIILGSATPSLESMRNVEEKKYTLLTLHERAGQAKQPTVILHDVRNEKLQYGLSALLIETMRTHLDRGEQVLLFLNRRGFAPIALCHHCGWSKTCAHCDARMTVHQAAKKMICHHCGFQTAMARCCESCKQNELICMGVGTEQLENGLAILFPEKKRCRIDRDVVKTFSQLEKKLRAIHAGEADIIFGTQMIVKGHHFENVTLVAAIDVDQALFSGDFRATEKLGQSLLQVAGRAGRAEKQGEVFIQTYQPKNPLLTTLFEKKYDAFAKKILAERKQVSLPPYLPMIAIRAESREMKKTIEFLKQAKKIMLNDSVQISDPIPALMEKKAGVYRAFLFLQSRSRLQLNYAMDIFIAHTEKDRTRVKWVIDVDPVEVC